MKVMIRKLTQTQMIVIGYALIILIGSLFLMLPAASRDGLATSFPDALFTATSASCVTGLVIADTFNKWTMFGQCIILALIQIGGLGFMTIGVFFAIILRRKIGLWMRGTLQESVNILQIGGIVRCNAGFDLMGKDAPYASFTGYYDDPLVNIVIMALIIIGGIGFFVWNDVSAHRYHISRYRLHTKIVLVTTAILVIGGAALLYLFESQNTLEGMSTQGKVLSSLFGSVTARTAGFNTVDTAALTDNSKMLTIFLMFIGGSPGSTAGGIKTTTFVVLLVYVSANLRNKTYCNIFGRRLDDGAIRKASTVLCTNLFLVFMAVMILAAIQPQPVMDIVFEVASAIGTVGMSTGITRDLTEVSKLVLVFLMYCGRVGSLTFALSLRGHKAEVPVKVPVEPITIG